VKKPAEKTEYDRYVKAARIVFSQNKSVVEAVKQAGVCIPDFVELSKVAAWPKSPKWSDKFRRTSDVEKLLLMAAMTRSDV
jgi:hypothetical protein